MRSISSGQALKIIAPCFLLFLALQPGSCAYSTLPEYNESKPCNTTISGYFPQEEIWSGPSPAILLSHTGEIIRGETTKLDSSGIYFLPKKMSFLHFPDTVFYTYDKIETAVDGHGKCIYGEIPNRYQQSGINLKIELKSLTRPQSSAEYICALPNEGFKYCIRSDKYQVENIYWMCDKYYYKFTPVHDATITIPIGKNTDIGEITIIPTEDATFIHFGNEKAIVYSERTEIE
jgi:hypothetical protein